MRTSSLSVQESRAAKASELFIVLSPTWSGIFIYKFFLDKISLTVYYIFYRLLKASIRRVTFFPLQREDASAESVCAEILPRTPVSRRSESKGRTFPALRGNEVHTSV